jgi:hypothetical protein
MIIYCRYKYIVAKLNSPQVNWAESDSSSRFDKYSLHLNLFESKVEDLNDIQTHTEERGLTGPVIPGHWPRGPTYSLIQFKIIIISRMWEFRLIKLLA